MKRIPKIIEIVNLSEKRILEPSTKKGKVPLIEQISKFRFGKPTSISEKIPFIEKVLYM